MPFAGNFLRTKRTVTPDATQLPTADPAHADESTPDPYPWGFQAPPGADYSGTAMPDRIEQTRGLVLDAPTGSHDAPSVLGAYRTQLEYIQASATAHSDATDRGFVRQGYRDPGFQDDATRYLATRDEGAGPAVVAPVALVRGINSNEENNPVTPGYDGRGWRRGFHRWAFVDRKVPPPPRHYNAQPLQPRTIQVPENEPVPSNPSPRTSPFDSLARALPQGGFNRPALYRGPQNLTESVIADSPAPVEYPAAVADWVL